MTKAEQMIKEYKATHSQTETKIVYIREPNNIILITGLLTTAFFTFGLGFILRKVRG